MKNSEEMTKNALSRGKKILEQRRAKRVAVIKRAAIILPSVLIFAGLAYVIGIGVSNLTGNIGFLGIGSQVTQYSGSVTNDNPLGDGQTDENTTKNTTTAERDPRIEISNEPVDMPQWFQTAFAYNGNVFYETRAKVEKFRVMKKYSHTEIFTAIGYRAFSYSEIKEVYLPDSIEYIYEYAFAESTVELVYLCPGIKEIGEGAFFACKNLKTIYFCGSEEEWNSIRKGDKWDETQGEEDFKIILCPPEFPNADINKPETYVFAGDTFNKIEMLFGYRKDFGGTSYAGLEEGQYLGGFLLPNGKYLCIKCYVNDSDEDPFTGLQTNMLEIISYEITDREPVIINKN